MITAQVHVALHLFHPQTPEEPATSQARLHNDCCIDTSTSSDTTYCSSCSNANDASQCWCVECGCSLLAPAHMQSVASEHRTNLTRQRKPLYRSEKRRWSKATFYMWRTPSTLSRTTQSPSYNQQSVVPRLSASKLQENNVTFAISY